MIFDEAKRAKLFNEYKALPEDERAAYRVLAVTFLPVSVTTLSNILREVRPGYDWRPIRCEEMLTRWAQKRLAEKGAERGAAVWTCAPLITEPAAREALDKDEFDAIDETAVYFLKLADEERTGKYSSMLNFTRAARNVFYRGDAVGYSKLMLSNFARTTVSFGDSPELNPFLRVLANPLDTERLLSMPPRLGITVFEHLIPLCMGMRDAGMFTELLAAFGSYRLKYSDDAALAEAWAEYAALSGHVEEAAAVLEKFPTAEKYSMSALAALTRGEPLNALALYEEGLKALRKKAGKQKIGYFSWTGVFYPLLLINEALNNASGGGGYTRKILKYTAGTRERSGGYSLTAFDLIPFLLPNELKIEEFWQYEAVFVRGNAKPADVFFFILFAYWLDVKRLSRLRTLAVNTYKRLAEMKLYFPASELAAIISELWPDNEINFDTELKGAAQYPVKDLITRQADWERSLSALSGIGLKTSVYNRGARRLAWEITWVSDRLGTPSGRRPSYIELVPVEQTLLSSGWSKGKNVALRRLYRKSYTVESMTEQDLRAISAIQENREYGYGHGYDIYVPQALEALAGHPYLFRENDGGHVEVVADEPQLTAVMENGRYRVRVSPFPDEYKAPLRVVQEDGPNCLRVTRFEERHIKMAEILGENGMLFPAGAKDALLKTLGILASVVTVHSDIEGIETNAVQTEADPRIYIQLQPFADSLPADLDADTGATGLDVDMVVRPLGPGGVSCRPGEGGQNIFGRVNSKRTQARRSLDKEKEALMTAVRACPVLTEAEQPAAERWRLPRPEQALEFLEQAQELGDSVVLEWPKGRNMKVKYTASMSSMEVSARGRNDWFALSGELKVGEDLVLGMKELMELMKTGCGRFIPIGGGQFLALTKEFRRSLEAIAAMSDAKGNELRVSPLSVGTLAPLLDEFGASDEDTEWKKARKRIDEASELNPSPPSTFKGELRQYQLEGFQWLSRLAHRGAGACLADDMGLGKTIQALALLTARGSGGPALVVAPTSVCANWINEAGRFAPTLNLKELRYGDREKTLEELSPFDVVITAYGLLQNEIGRLSAVRWNTVVLDEAQAIKNMGTKRSMAAMKLDGDFRVATTGTPIENHLSELWNIFRFLNPHFLGSLESFNRRFAVPIERDGDKEARLRLKRVIQPFILRRSKGQVLEELPPKTEITVRVELKEEEQAFYEALRRNAVEELSGGDAVDRRFRIFAELMRLRRACCNASLVMPANGENPNDFPSAKMEAFSEILGELRDNGHKALVFSQFTDHLSIIRKELDERGVPYQYLDGNTTVRERARRVAAFQAGEGDCFLISLKAGGTGLNLTAADYVIHMDPWWNPAVEEQASDRAHRIGQNRPVTVYRIVAKDTIEEKIVDLHAWKRDLAESLLDNSEVPPQLSAEEMLELIREAK